jgi:hypothetical protein
MNYVTMLGIALLLCCGSRAADRGLGSLLGEQVGLVEKLEALSQKGEYAEIHTLLAAGYRSVVGRDQFVSISKASSWKITQLRFGTISTHARVAYMPVRATVTADSKTLEIDSVVFFVKQESVWKLQNFPFLPARLPDFAAIPEWLADR